jgi:methylglutaconyl-CoA hydratase
MVVTTGLAVERRPGAAIVRLDRPDDRNRLDDAMIAALHAALDACDPAELLVLRGNGDGFSAGRPHSTGGHPDGPAAARRALDEVVRLNLRLSRWAAPTLALVHGYANGAALGILQHVDVVIAARGTRLSFPEITYHLPPGLVASYLRRFVNEKAARYLVMTGDEIDADRGAELGLVSAVAAPEDLDAEGERLVAHFTGRLEAEIALKTTLASLSPITTDLNDAMQRGLADVIAFARRPKPAAQGATDGHR